MPDDPCTLPARELARRICERELSATEALEAHLAWIAARNPVLNAVVSLDYRRQGEAQWLLPEGTLSYCRLRVNEIEFIRPILSERTTDPRTLRSMEQVLQYARHEGDREQYGLASAAADAAVRSCVEAVR